MLFSLLALAIGVAAIHISDTRCRLDEITLLLINLMGLFSLFLSLLYSPWFIKLLIVAAMLVAPICAQKHHLRQVRCSSFCMVRSNCSDCST